MAHVDIVAATFDELDDMVTVFGFNHFRYLAVFQSECRSLKFGHQLASSLETELTAFLGRTRVFGIKQRHCGETLAFQDTGTQSVKTFFHCQFLVEGDWRFLYQLGYLVLRADHRD